MVAKGIPATRTAPQSTATPIVSKSLSDAEREVLRNARGCFHCKKTPSSPGWVSHTSRNCPGDESRGILPRTPLAPTAVNAISAVITSRTNEHLNEDDPDINKALAAVLPSCVLGNGTDSEEDWDDDD